MANGKKGLSEYLDALIDKDGLKTDITVSVPKENLLQIAVYLTGAIVVGSIGYFTVRAIFKNLESRT